MQQGQSQGGPSVLSWLTRALLRAACSQNITPNAVRISLVVGTVLNVINQAGAIFAGAGMSWTHVLLNYLVPNLVATNNVATNNVAKNQTARIKERTECKGR